jgi:HAD superfamily hydrolase (TIGR01509 family)
VRGRDCAIDFGGVIILRVDLICIDMFQTLVDINVRIPIIWQRILQDKYSDEIGEMCAKQVSLKVINQFHETGCKSTEFYNLRALFAPCFREIAIETNLGFNPDSALEIFLLEHGNSALYDDSLQFFELIDSRVPICLVSDADNIMIQPLLKKFRFDSVYVSEDVGSYKNDNKCRMFSKVLDYYQIKPDKALHIGDSSSDILGANKAGIKSCWINRHKSEWKYEGKPDYIVNSLIEVIELIS